VPRNFRGQVCTRHAEGNGARFIVHSLGLERTNRFPSWNAIEGSFKTFIPLHPSNAFLALECIGIDDRSLQIAGPSYHVLVVARIPRAKGDLVQHADVPTAGLTACRQAIQVCFDFRSEEFNKPFYNIARIASHTMSKPSLILVTPSDTYAPSIGVVAHGLFYFTSG
jgi:hypothetical protein